VRAADSVGANIAEGAGRGSFQDNRRHARIARGSLNETKPWLRRAFRRRLLSPLEVDQIKPLVDELSPRLNACLRSITQLIGSQKANQRTTNHEPRATDS